MPKLSEHKSQLTTKLLFIGDSGSGKTGALASLVKAGYNLRILDFDNGLDILVNILAAEANAEELLSRVTFVTLIDKMKATLAGSICDGVPKAFSRGLQLMTNWKTEEEDLGSIDTWTEKDILVIDSLTFMCKAAFRYVEITGGFKDPRQVYGESQRKIEDMLNLLSSAQIKCNIIVTSHITFIDAANNITRGYPASIGKALSPQIPRYFNSVLEAKTKGSGVNAKHVILTVPDGLIELKNSGVPGQIPPELPLNTGLAQFFKLI